MPVAATSAKYSATARKFEHNTARGLAGGRAGQLLAKPTPKRRKKPSAALTAVWVKGTDHLKRRTGYRTRMPTLGWVFASPFNPLGHQSFILDRHGNVLACSPIYAGKGQAKAFVRRRVQELIKAYDEGRF